MDELVIPGTFLMKVGRIGNFIDGQIVESITAVPWAVQFPDTEGFRHPVVLYDGIQNLLPIPLLLILRKHSKPIPGRIMAHFILAKNERQERQAFSLSSALLAACHAMVTHLTLMIARLHR